MDHLILPDHIRRAPKKHQFIAPLTPDVVFATGFGKLVAALSRLDGETVKVQTWYQVVGTEQTQALMIDLVVNDPAVLAQVFTPDPKFQQARDLFFGGVLLGTMLRTIAENHGFDYDAFHQYVTGVLPGQVPTNLNPALN